MVELRNDDSNPYRPPSTPNEPRPLFSFWGSLFGSAEQAARTRFENGDMIIFEGIAFFVDPNNRSTLYAASPSSDSSETRMNLIIAEVVRLVPQFAACHEHLKSSLANRKISVCMIDSYGDKYADFVREVSLDLDLLS